MTLQHHQRRQPALQMEKLESRVLLCADGPFDFEITSPAENETVYTSTPFIEWNVPTGANGFDAFVSTDAAGENVVDIVTVNSSETKVFLGPLPNGILYVHVVSLNLNVPGNLLPACNTGLPFTVDTTNAPALEHVMFLTNDVYNVNPPAEPNPIGNEFGGFSSADFQITKAAAFGGMLPQWNGQDRICLLYTSPSPRDATLSRMPSSA